MRLEQFEYLIEVSKTNSINLASENLHISQQSLSKSLRTLENELGVALLERNSRGAYLTPNGLKMVEYAKQVICGFETLQQEFSNQPSANPKEKKGKLSIVHTNTITFSSISKGIRDFNYHHPSIQLHAVERSLVSAITDLLDYRADLGLVSLTDSAEMNRQLVGNSVEQLNFTPLHEDRLIVAVSSNSPLAKHKSISIRSLLKHPLIIFQSGDDLEIKENWLCKILEDYGKPKYGLITNSLDLYFNAIIDNSGIGFFSQSSLKHNHLLNRSAITTIPIRDAIRIHSGYITRKEPFKNPLTADFIQSLTEYCTQINK